VVRQPAAASEAAATQRVLIRLAATPPVPTQKQAPPFSR
jgi:hypothetical protein